MLSTPYKAYTLEVFIDADKQVYVQINYMYFSIFFCKERTFVIQMVVAGVFGAFGCLVIAFCNIQYRYILYLTGMIIFITSLVLTLWSVKEIPYSWHIKYYFLSHKTGPFDFP
jgi:hypothetical protein